MKRQSLINQIQEKYVLMKKEKDFISEEEKKFEEKVAKAKQVIDTQHKEIRALGESVIPVNVETLVEVIAEELGVDVKDLVVDINFEHSVFGKISKEKLIKYWKDNQSVAGAIYAELIVTAKEKGYKVSYMRRLNQNQHQRNGEKLIDFLDVETKQNGDVTETNFTCSDYKNLKFYYRLKELVDINNGKILSPYMGLVYEAYERDNKNKYFKNI